jgi:hypothetical protein
MNEKCIFSHRSQTGGSSVLLFENRSRINGNSAISSGKQLLMLFHERFEPRANPMVIINSASIFDNAGQLPDGMRLTVQDGRVGNAEHKNRPNAGQERGRMLSCLEIADEVRHFGIHTGLKPTFEGIEMFRRFGIGHPEEFKAECLGSGE